MDLSLRWMQPSQQQGLRIPSFSSLIVLLTCSFLVSSFLTNVTQHIHSLRARGVRSSHIASAARSDVSAFRKSAGTLCTTPCEIVLLIVLFYQVPFLSYPRNVCNHPFSQTRAERGRLCIQRTGSADRVPLTRKPDQEQHACERMFYFVILSDSSVLSLLHCDAMHTRKE